MSTTRLILESDLRQLHEERFAVEIRGGGASLVVREVPYVAAEKQVKRGILVCPLAVASGSEKSAYDGQHTVFWTAEKPCQADGTPIDTVGIQEAKNDYGSGIVSRFQFSSKPSKGYRDYYHKMTTYIEKLEGPAREVDPLVSAKLPEVVELKEEDSVFRYADTASARSGIVNLGERLERGNVGIVGLGGTGSYILDMVAKTPVPEIHLFDGDVFQSHNAFRAPGAAPLEVVQRPPYKVEYLAQVYRQMRRRIVPHVGFLVKENLEELKAMAFVFVAMDEAPSKRPLLEALVGWKIPFIDVGMGLTRGPKEMLRGQLRVTSATLEKSDHAFDGRIPFMPVDAVVNEYAKNIQIVELNAINAGMAVLKWKKLWGFYVDVEHEHDARFMIEANYVVNDEKTAGGD